MCQSESKALIHYLSMRLIDFQAQLEFKALRVVFEWSLLH